MMSEFKIEKNIPIPIGRAANHKYPLAEMEVGDSLFIPGITIPKIAGSCSFQRPKKFVCRTVEGGIRVWRKS